MARLRCLAHCGGREPACAAWLSTLVACLPSAVLVTPHPQDTQGFEPPALPRRGHWCWHSLQCVPLTWALHEPAFPPYCVVLGAHKCIPARSALDDLPGAGCISHDALSAGRAHLPRLRTAMNTWHMPRFPIARPRGVLTHGGCPHLRYPPRHGHKMTDNVWLAKNPRFGSFLKTTLDLVV